MSICVSLTRGRSRVGDFLFSREIIVSGVEGIVEPFNKFGIGIIEKTINGLFERCALIAAGQEQAREQEQDEESFHDGPSDQISLR